MFSDNDFTVITSFQDEYCKNYRHQNSDSLRPINRKSIRGGNINISSYRQRKTLHKPSKNGITRITR